MSEARCSTPGCGAKAVVAGECRACYMYRRRHGRGRPREVIVRAAIRRFEDAEHSRLIRSMLRRRIT